MFRTKSMRKKTSGITKTIEQNPLVLLKLLNRTHANYKNSTKMCISRIPNEVNLQKKRFKARSIKDTCVKLEMVNKKVTF
jgi:hypothetical protein